MPSHADHKCIMIFIRFAFVIAVSCDVQLHYLRGVHLLARSTYQNYFFNCHTEGEMLQWTVDNQSLSGYSGRHVGDIITGTTSNCRYSATLLSLISAAEGQFVFDSVLIVTCPQEFNFNIVCFNGSFTMSISNSENKMNLEAESQIDSVVIQYILTQQLVWTNDSKCTRIFVCGVNSTRLNWQISGNGFDDAPITIFDPLGFDRRTLQDDQNTVKQQAILIAQEPFNLVSALLLVDGSERTVTCGFSNNMVNISIMTCLEPATTDITTEIITQATTTEIITQATTASMTELPGVASPNVTNLALTVGLSCVGGILLIILPILLLSLIYFVVKKKRIKGGCDEVEIQSDEEPNEQYSMQENETHFKTNMCSDFCKRVQIIIVSSNDHEFGAAVHTIQAPEIKECSDKVVQVNENVYIGMIGCHPVGLIQAMEKSVDTISDAVNKHFHNAEYVLALGGCDGINSATVKFGDVLISQKIVCPAPYPKRFSVSIEDVLADISSIFCCDSDTVEGLQVTTNGRKARHLVGRIASDLNLLKNTKLTHLANVFDEVLGFERIGKELMNLQKDGITMKDGQNKKIMVCLVCGVDNYMGVTRQSGYTKWSYVATRAAFNYVEAKLKTQQELQC